MLYAVLDVDNEEELGDIECDPGDILEALEQNDYIEGGSDFSLSHGPDDLEYVLQRGRRILILESKLYEDEDEDEEDEDEDD